MTVEMFHKSWKTSAVENHEFVAKHFADSPASIIKNFSLNEENFQRKQ